MTRPERLRALMDLNYPQNQRNSYLVCTDCGSLSIVSKRDSTKTRRPSHFRSNPTLRVRRPRKYVRQTYQRRQGKHPNALAELLAALVAVVIVAVALHHLGVPS